MVLAASDSPQSDSTKTYAELHCISNFTFLRGASHPEELVERAIALGYSALAITDECSIAGVVRAHVAAKEHNLKLIIGSEFRFQNNVLVLLAPNRKAYGQLCRLISLCRRNAAKGQYALEITDLQQGLSECLALWRPEGSLSSDLATGHQLTQYFKSRLWLLVERLLNQQDESLSTYIHQLSQHFSLPKVAAGDVHMHLMSRQKLQDILTSIRCGSTINKAVKHLHSNGERYLRSLKKLHHLYPQELLQETLNIANRCEFSLEELKYEYPSDLVPPGISAIDYLKQLVKSGEKIRFPNGTPKAVTTLIKKELELIEALHYEHYFLTIYDIVRFARSKHILCQGRGSAANSVVCYCLQITEVDPTKVTLLFERFISKERNEPPDIDVDFEHERREEVIQYIYQKYSRDRAALTATVITYRSRSAIRDIGKALNIDLTLIERLLSGIDWRDALQPWHKQAEDKNIINANQHLMQHFIELVDTIRGFPRHLSQHVGGFVISSGPLDQLVPIENASMPERTIIQWDKDDLEALGLLKVDILALGMLTAIRKAIDLANPFRQQPLSISNIPAEDPAVYTMLQQGDSVGVFQVESRAQISMLPRLKPANYYDLVIEVAIVRPGPIQGDMVHPYLLRRQGLETVNYPNNEVREVLERTLGVPIFQEQVIKLAMVAAGFTAGEADQLRRAMANWKRNGKLKPFQEKLTNGMLARGHSKAFAERVYRQISGFGEYGFPESHAASFALLVYISSWLKRHEPSAFYCGLLNSQPMGFYSPYQLIQDAKRHQVNLLPIDIEYSYWDHHLEAANHPNKAKKDVSLRLGFRLIKGLAREAALIIAKCRPDNGYQSLTTLKRLSGVSNAHLELLASAGALRSLSGHRYQARWDILALKTPAPIFQHDNDHDPSEAISLPAPSEGETIIEDVASTGLTLERHPVSLLRQHPTLSRSLSASALLNIPHKALVEVVGLVTGRQRPGSATGVTFVTLEDETGNINVVVWQATAKHQRQALLTSKLLKINGFLEREGNVIHVIAGKLTNLNHLIDTLDIASRDFK